MSLANELVPAVDGIVWVGGVSRSWANGEASSCPNLQYFGRDILQATGGVRSRSPVV